MPSRRSIKARFWPYCPNSVAARRLSSKVRTIWVVLSGPTKTDSSGVRNSGSCADTNRLLHGVLRKQAEQSFAGGFGDGDGGDLANQGRRCLDLHRLEIGRPAEQLTAKAASALEQHVEGAAETGAIERRLIALDGVLQLLQALRLGFFVDLIGHRCARCAGPR